MKEIELFAFMHADWLVGGFMFSIIISTAALLFSCLRSKRGRGQIR